MFFCEFRGLGCLCLLAGLLSASSFGAWAQNTVTLAWDPETGDFIAGYRLYSGIASQTYTNMLDVGNTTSATFSNLTAGTTYYFAVTAYDLAGLESAFSGEVSCTIPVNPSAPANLNVAFTPTQGAVLTGTAPPGNAYDVLVSTDLSSWTAIGSVVTDANGTLQFTEPGAPAVGARYYRLQQTSP